MDWRELTHKPSDDELNALCVFFIRPGNYAFGTPSDIALINKDYPEASHYKIISESPLKLLAENEPT